MKRATHHGASELGFHAFDLDRPAPRSGEQAGAIHMRESPAAARGPRESLPRALGEQNAITTCTRTVAPTIERNERSARSPAAASPPRWPWPCAGTAGRRGAPDCLTMISCREPRDMAPHPSVQPLHRRFRPVQVRQSAAAPPRTLQACRACLARCNKATAARRRAYASMTVAAALYAPRARRTAVRAPR